MFYHIFYGLSSVFTPFNVFQYITFRAGGAVLTSLLICLFAGPYVIKKLKKLKAGQTVRSDGPSTHQLKNGTPTMGGILILISVLISVLLWARLDNRFILWLTGGSLWLFLLGFFDDYLKVSQKNSKGISSGIKLFWQSVLAAAFAGYITFFPSNPEYACLVNVP
ncbi:MAG: phospho-N-acetylmuramoyl-pentapeptide-transferase, partial [Endomicrobium sp.]|nr:phospho-N-acetylmuramoyl-pentapeptide-transferase [Endomicrobium sp.]